MANSVSYQRYERVNASRANFKGVYKITVSGSYTQTTGESINLLTASNANGLELNGAVPSGTGAEVDVDTANIGGYVPVISGYSNGTFTLQFFTSGGTELPAAAYPAGISGGSVTVAVPHTV